jgi:hypothetical protein
MSDGEEALRISRADSNPRWKTVLAQRNFRRKTTVITEKGTGIEAAFTATFFLSVCIHRSCKNPER